jgi:hypothetical protein
MQPLNKLKNSDRTARKLRDQINILTAELKRVRQISARGPGIRTFSGVNGTQICIPRQYVPDSTIRRAKTQEAAQTDGKISVKLVDDAGTERGDAFDVYAFFTKAATNMQLCLPKISSGDFMMISKIAGSWYLMAPTLIAKGSNASTVNGSDLTQSDTISGAVLSAIGEW